MRVRSLLPIAAVFLVMLITAALWRGMGEPRNSHDTAAAEKPSFEPAQKPDVRSADLRVSEAEALENAAPPTLERSAIAAAIDTHLPDLKLSDTELDDLADAALRLRQAQASLRRLPEVRERATQRADARQRLIDAIADFTYVVGMTPAEFTQRVQPDLGIDREGSDSADSEPLIRPIPATEEPP